MFTGLVGLSLAYALPITDRLNGLLTVSAETEQEMVAVERLAEYTHLPCQPSTLPPHRALPEQELALPFQSEHLMPLCNDCRSILCSYCTIEACLYLQRSPFHIYAHDREHHHEADVLM